MTWRSRTSADRYHPPICHEGPFGGRETPWLVGNSSYRKSGRCYPHAIQRQSGRNGNDGELVGLTVANLEVMRCPALGTGGDVNRDDQLLRPSTVSCSGASPGRRWKSANGIAYSPWGPRTRTVASSAASATAKSGVPATQASDQLKMAWWRLSPCSAEHPEPGSTFVAWQPIVITEIGAAGALQDVARNRGHVAQLAGCRKQQGLRNDRKALPHTQIGSHVAHPGQGANAQPTTRQRLDCSHPRQPIDVQQPRGA